MHALPCLTIRDCRSSGLIKIVAVLSFGWMPMNGALMTSSSRYTSTFLSASFNMPSGVTLPFGRARYFIRPFSEAKLNGLNWMATLVSLRLTVLSFCTTKR